jgi:hypothetical protein
LIGGCVGVAGGQQAATEVRVAVDADPDGSGEPQPDRYLLLGYRAAGIVDEHGGVVVER